jgi:Ca-activated chloride channel homolog
MSFLWPTMLWLLAAVPLMIGGYLLLGLRRKRVAARYANLAMVRDAMGRDGGLRRRLPPVLFLAAMILLLVASARPVTVVMLPAAHETVILAIDVSGSMRADDIQPSRIEAAQVAAKAFIAEQPRSTRVGIVTFAGSASLVQPPTQNREDLLAAIDRFQLQRATAIGSGIVVSLAAIFPDAGIDLASLEARRPGGRPGAAPGGAAERGQRPDRTRDGIARPAFEPVPPGSYGSAVIVLLSDGQATTGPDPREAAKMAADRGVRIFTVGLGTPKGAILRNEGWSMRVMLDEPTLKSIAETTRGEYFLASTGPDLTKVYQSLNSRFLMERQQTEVTALFAAAAALLALLAAGLSVLWFNRIL